MKNYVMMLSMLAILLLPSCFATEEQPARTSYMIFWGEIINHPGLKKLQDTLPPLINAIIKEELNIAGDAEYPQFILKPHLWITLYYLDGYVSGQESLITHALDTMQHHKRGICLPTNITLSDNAAFFGDKQEELVILINDPDKSLHVLHTDVKDALTTECTTYNKHHNHHLYDKSKSERYPFVPHISIGRLQSASLAAAAPKKDVVTHIKQRIEKEVFPVIAKVLNDKNREVQVDTVTVYAKKRHVKRYKLVACNNPIP